MKSAYRILALSIFTIISGQFFSSCSTNNLQCHKAGFGNTEQLDFAQIQNFKTENPQNINEAEISTSSNNVFTSEEIKPVVSASVKNELVIIKTRRNVERKIFVLNQQKLGENKILVKKFSNKNSIKIDEPEKAKKGKSQIIALVLAFFFGGYGIHRFYLGHTKSALLQLALSVAGIIMIISAYVLAIIFIEAAVLPLAVIVLGVLGTLALLATSIWTIIDVIRIATGSLKPAEGEYTDTI